ncbi:MAG: molybdopterin molybdotransferase MoeA [Nitrospirae bacterium]|nr:molybdopterin molybdotransferase MoeA [Nitrospirota bacterium]
MSSSADTPRPSVLPIGEARRLVLEQTRRLDVKEVPALSALGCVLAGPVSAAWDQPGFDASAMDGYAVRSEDTTPATSSQPVTLLVRGVARAGAASRARVRPGTSVRIMTGAPLPPGADAVIEQEAVQRSDAAVEIRGPVEPGRNVRPRGSDMKAGTHLVADSEIVTPAVIALAAAAGRERLSIYRKPRITILVTGDELASAGSRPRHGRVRDLNTPLAAAFLKDLGLEPAALIKVRDSEATLVRHLRAASRSSDIVIATGGVSVGDFDYLPRALAQLQAKILFSGVAQKPGKPLTVARLGPALLFGLPGNPVAVFVGLYEYVRPSILKMMGRPATDLSLPLAWARLSKPLEIKPGRAHFLRVSLDQDADGYVATVLPGQESYQVSNLVWTDALAVLDGETSRIDEGEVVPVHLMPWFEGGCVLGARPRVQSQVPFAPRARPEKV